MNHMVPTFLRASAIAAIAVFSFVAASEAFAAPQLSVKNQTNPSYSIGATYAQSVRAEPGDVLEFQMFGNNTSASTYSTTLPDGLSYTATNEFATGGSAVVAVNGQEVSWSFAQTPFGIIRFTATVADGSALGADHSLEALFTAAGAQSNAADIAIGPIVTGITPVSGDASIATAISEIIGHGLTGATRAWLSADGATVDHEFNLSGAVITDTSISGPNIRIPAGLAAGGYWVMAQVESGGNELATNADEDETVRYEAVDASEQPEPEPDPDPDPEPSPGGGGGGGAVILPGGGGGSTSPSGPSVRSSSKQITPVGGTFALDLASGAQAGLAVPPDAFSENMQMTITEATSSDLQAAPLGASVGTLLAGSAVNMQAEWSGQAVNRFSKPVHVRFTYTGAQLGAHSPSSLRIAYFDEDADAWLPLQSEITPNNRSITATTEHFTLFGIISYVNPPQDNSGTAPGTGQVLGTSIGAHPNGTLLKTAQSPAVWHISGGKKSLIRSAAIFESRFNWDDVVVLPSAAQLDRYEQGPDVAFAPGTLVKAAGDPAVYRVSAAGGIAPIVSGSVFLQRGHSFASVVTVAAETLLTYPTESVITDASAALDGDLVKLAGEPAVYYAEAGKARPILSGAIFREHAFQFSNVRTISSAQFSALGQGTPLSYPDGTLVKGSSPAVYVISDNAKRPIVSAADFEAFGYDWGRIVHAPDETLAVIPNAGVLAVVTASQ